MTIKFRYETKVISRDVASKIVEDLNTGNRKVNESHVYTIGKDIESGLFRFNPNPIVIHEDHKKASLRLLDGQHRMVAASRHAPAHGVKMMFCFVQGNEMEINSLQASIDSGKPRNMSDRGGFCAFGLAQGYVEKATRMFNVIGCKAEYSSDSVYNWIDAPKASYAACKEFAADHYDWLTVAYSTAARHHKSVFSDTCIKKEYLALVYLMAIANNVSIDRLDAFAAEVGDSSSFLSAYIKNLSAEDSGFQQAVKAGSKNASGIQVLLAKDLLLGFLNNTLNDSFHPTLHCKEVDGTMFTDFMVN